MVALSTDRSQYGDKLVERLSQRLVQAGVSRAEARELRRYRQFYLTYPSIRESVTPELGIATPAQESARQAPGGESGSGEGGR